MGGGTLFNGSYRYVQRERVWFWAIFFTLILNSGYVWHDIRAANEGHNL